MEVKPEWLQWLAGRDTGISSKTMLSALTGMPTIDTPDIPYDIGDMGRCIRMLRQLPDLRDKLHLVIEKHKEWMPFIDCWMQLERDYDECVKFQELPEPEKKKIIKKRGGESPNDSYWNLMCELVCASRYLRGMRFQNHSGSMRNKAPDKF